MINKKIDLNALLKLSFVIIVSGMYLMATDSLINNIISLFILAFGAAAIVKFNITHPYVWFSAFFTIYATGYPILLYLNASSVNYGYRKELLSLHWVALVTFLVVVSPRVTDIKSIRNNVSQFNCVLSKYLYYILSCTIIVLILYINSRGFSSKTEMNSSGSSVIYFGMRLVLIYILITSIELIKEVYKTNKLDYKIISTTFILLLLLVIFSAERDLLLRYVIVLFLIYYIFLYKKRDKVKLIIISISLFLFVPISRSIKFLGMRGETVSLNNNIIVEFINSEFHTQARNVQVLLNSQMYNGYFKGKTFITSISNFFGVTDFSTIGWYHETFYPRSATGMGFSLVGEGYINFGYIGVVLMFIVLGMIIKNAYKRSNKSVYSLVIYLMLIPISIYGLRADLYNVLSQYIKQVLLIVILLKFSDGLLIAKKENINIKKGSGLSEKY